MPTQVSDKSLAVVLFSDIVGSTAIKSQIGSSNYGKLLTRHNQIFESTILDYADATILKHTGDGYFARFARAADAVDCSLRFQQQMASEDWPTVTLKSRVGIHSGEVHALQMAGQADIIGLTADLAARIMSLALGGQILMSRSVFDESRQVISRDSINWLAHGHYVFKGIEESVDIFEVGLTETAPLSPPPDAEKAKRAVPIDQESTLGWRPSIRQPIKTREEWILQKKLGEGGFGEVWLGVNRDTGSPRVFKFCFDPERLRSFKRELTLFRLLRDALGDRDDITRLFEVKLDQPPFFLESEYSESGNLNDWADTQGGIGAIPLADRIRLVAEVADAVAAAHSVGVLHKDIKPSNILVRRNKDGHFSAQLADFGIGILTDPSQLGARAITETGFTLITQNDSSRTGTRMYSPPESLQNRPFTIQGDVYALGILLYQMAVADLSRPLAEGWQRDASDEIIRGDIAAMIDRDLTRRLSSAAIVAQRLHTLNERKQSLAETQTRERQLASQKRRQRWVVGSSFALTSLMAVAFFLAVKYMRAIQFEQAQTQVALNDKSRSETDARQKAAIAEASSKFLADLLAANNPDRPTGPTLTIAEAVREAQSNVDNGALADQPLVEASVRTAMGNTFRTLSLFAPAESNLRRAVELYRQYRPPNHPDLAKAIYNHALSLESLGRLSEAEQMTRESIAMLSHNKGIDPVEASSMTLNLAAILQAENKLDESAKLFQEVLQTRKKLLSPNDPRIAEVLTNYANLYMSRGDARNAEALHRRALTILEASLPAGHIRIGAALNNLGEAVRQMGRASESERYFRRALDIGRKALPGDHESVAQSLCNLGVILDEQQKYSEAEPLFAEALAMRRRLLPPDHPDLAASILNLGMVLADQEKLKEAEPLYKEALAIDRKILDPLNPGLAIDLNNYAVLCDKLGQFEQAEKYYLEALSIREKHFGPTKLETQRVAFNLADMLDRARRPEDAARIRKNHGIAPPSTKPWWKLGR